MESKYKVYRNIDIDETPVLIKGGRTQLHGYFFYNNAVTVRYVKIYDKNTAPVLASDTPLMTIPVPAQGGANIEFIGGVILELGLGIACTTGVADNDVAAPSANDLITNILYK
jgi:hypothetical protein